MNWNNITEESQIDTIVKESSIQPVLIFKHSTRCSISASALDRLERKWSQVENLIKPYYLDLLKYRAISNAIAYKLGVEHQSPQAIVIKNGKVVYHNSHMEINVDDMVELVK
jgi:bacillithiol system protein YtxJ